MAALSKGVYWNCQMAAGDSNAESAVAADDAAWERDWDEANAAPAWSAPVLLIGFLVLSTAVELALHKLGHCLARRGHAGLLRALAQLQSELLAVGLIVLLLGVVEVCGVRVMIKWAWTTRGRIKLVGGCSGNCAALEGSGRELNMPLPFFVKAGLYTVNAGTKRAGLQ